MMMYDAYTVYDPVKLKGILFLLIPNLLANSCKFYSHSLETQILCRNITNLPIHTHFRFSYSTLIMYFCSYTVLYRNKQLTYPTSIILFDDFFSIIPIKKEFPNSTDFFFLSYNIVLRGLPYQSLMFGVVAQQITNNK